MTQGRVRQLGIASALLVLVAAWAQQPNPEQHINLELAGEPIVDAMKVLSDATGFNILLSGTAQTEAKITVFIRDMPAERALEETVRVNGLHYVRNGDVVWVLTDEEYFQDFDLGHERRVVRLRHARAADVATILQSSLSENAKVTTHPDANVLVVSEVPERLEVLDVLIAELDRPTDTRVVQLNYATAREMLALLQNHVTSPATFQADARTNQLVLTDTPENLDAFERLVREFDRPDLVETRTYQLAYADASEVADLLREVLTGRRRSPTEGAGSLSEPGPREQPQVFTAPETARPGSRSSFELRRGAPAAAPGADVAIQPPAAQTPAAPVGTPVSLDAGVTPMNEEDAALGPLASIAADPRTNTVIITHTAGVLDRLETIITQVDVPNEFHRYQFQFANPADLELETRLAQLLPIDGAFLNVDALSRTVTFRAQTDRADEILELLRTWDYNVRQVVIEAQILSVNVSLIKDLGISWQAVLEDAGNMLDRSIDANIFFPPAIASTSPQGSLRVGNIASDDYTAVIQALTNDNDTQVIARPYITVRDGQEAVFSSARDEPFTVVTVDGNTDTTLQDVRFLNVGTTLTVSPNIHPNDLVTLDVALELSDLVEIRNAIPVVDRSTAQSSITVADNGTLILGGLRQSSRSLNHRGVPGLSKVPVLGGLFRNKHRDDSEFEVLLVLRPRIVHEPNQNPADPDTVHHDLKLDLKRNLQEHRSGDRHTDDAQLVPPIGGDTHSRNYKPRAK